MFIGYVYPCMVQSGQLVSGRLRSPPTQSTLFLVSDGQQAILPWWSIIGYILSRDMDGNGKTVHVLPGVTHIP